MTKGLRQDYLNGRLASADVVADATGKSATMTAVDLTQLPAVISELNSFAQVLNKQAPRTVARARTYAQPFTSIFGEQVAPSYIDLAHFAALAAREFRRSVGRRCGPRAARTRWAAPS